MQPTQPCLGHKDCQASGEGVKGSNGYKVGGMSLLLPSSLPMPIPWTEMRNIHSMAVPHLSVAVKVFKQPLNASLDLF